MESTMEEAGCTYLCIITLYITYGEQNQIVISKIQNNNIIMSIFIHNKIYGGKLFS